MTTAALTAVTSLNSRSWPLDARVQVWPLVGMALERNSNVLTKTRNMIAPRAFRSVLRPFSKLMSHAICRRFDEGSRFWRAPGPPGRFVTLGVTRSRYPWRGLAIHALKIRSGAQQSTAVGAASHRAVASLRLRSSGYGCGRLGECTLPLSPCLRNAVPF